MLDTDAMLPVWCDSFSLLHHTYNIKRVHYKTIISGFGKGESVAPIYIIEKFKMIDNNGNCVVYHNLPIAYFPRDCAFSRILSYTMFTKTNMSILTYASSSNKDITPYITMHYKRYDIYANAIVTNNIMTNVSVFIQ